jgi:hypothetical protein
VRTSSPLDQLPARQFVLNCNPASADMSASSSTCTEVPTSSSAGANFNEDRELSVSRANVEKLGARIGFYIKLMLS